MGDLGTLQRTDAKAWRIRPDDPFGSWIYIGSQGIVQAPTAALRRATPALRRHLCSRWVLPPALAAWAAPSRWRRTLAGACSLNIECQQSRIDFRLRSSRYVDEQAKDLDDTPGADPALHRRRQGHLHRPAGQCRRDPELVRRGVRPDMACSTRPAPTIH
ncbi:hypothetical protein ACPA9J_23570 [Pseudomonas aeruginosa]